MPISYERDDARRRIITIGTGTFRADDILDLFARMRKEGAWAYGLLNDTRLMVGRPSVDDLKRILERASHAGPNGEHAGPIAVVASDKGLYAAACAYAAMGPPGRFDVFTDCAEAEAWLDSHLPRTPTEPRTMSLS